MNDNDCIPTFLDFLAGDLTAGEAEAVIAQVKGDERLAEQLLVVAADEARIAEWARSRAYDLAQRDLVSASRQRGARSAAWKTAPIALAIAAGAVAASLLLALQPAPAPDQDAENAVGVAAGPAGVNASDPMLARVIPGLADADWYLENRPVDENQVIRAGDTVRLNSGILRLAYHSGTVVSLQSPVVFEVKDDMHARVHRGNIRVLVAKGDQGFSVVTPQAKVIDLGTEFGVSVDERGGTDVVVFEGAVDIEGAGLSSGGAGSKRLNAGEALRLDERGTASRLVTVAADRFPTTDDSPAAAVRGVPLITGVRDDIDRDDNLSFYEVVPGGMGEDAHAYVDRIDHEWNGLTSQGMPEYLVGGDLVRMFNNDKERESLSVTVQLAEPATLYVLLDDRLPVPDWLAEGFLDTGDDLGLDEGSFYNKAHVKSPRGPWIIRHTGEGPGESIDTTFSVWARDVQASGFVHLGANLGEGKLSSINMYGIVAARLAGSRAGVAAMPEARVVDGSGGRAADSAQASQDR